MIMFIKKIHSNLASGNSMEHYGINRDHVNGQSLKRKFMETSNLRSCENICFSRKRMTKTSGQKSCD